MKLLCIEDNAELIDSLERFLVVGSTITHATKGKEGLKLLESGRYDAVILDLGLPDMPGAQVCRAIRDVDLRVPIIILSGVKDSKTKISLFEAGADDYVTKPFTIAELRARLFALLKRSSYSSKNDDQYVLKVGSLTLDPFTRHVERSGRQIALRRKEFEILEYLMRNQNKIVTRTMIMENVWEPEAVSWDGTINVHVKRMRDQVDRPFKRKLIKTAYGLGYTINNQI